MKRQERLDNFLLYQKDKPGRAIDKRSCAYLDSKGQRCALGCQPDWPKTLDRFQGSVEFICCLPNKQLRNFINNDIEFLAQLQKLHDTSSNWCDGKLRVTSLREFCQKWDLKVPAFVYETESFYVGT